MTSNTPGTKTREMITAHNAFRREFGLMSAEEQQVLPLIEQHITTAEWDEMAAEVIGTAPQDKMAVITGMMMYDGDPQAIEESIDKMPVEMRTIMSEMAPKAYAGYAEQVYGTPAPPHGDTLAVDSPTA
jgi:hypothetical protein